MKKLINIILAICISITVLVPAGITALAENYVSTISAFTYNGYRIPAYDGDIYEVINSNKPKFTSSQLNQSIYESYGQLDSQGRVTTAMANIDQSLMPTGSRGSISSVYPTGWKQNSYSFVNQKYLYNRSHLIAWCLTGEDANKSNLMTGTRSFNAVGMLKFENQVADYVKQNKENNVLYRVTPVFQGNNQLASGVIMEAESVDDLGASVCFCVFVYNVEDGVSIDYATGSNIESKKIYAKSPATKINKLTPYKKSMKVNWERQNSISGYQIRYSTDSKMKSAKKATVTKPEYYYTTIKKLTSGKKYYVQIRTFKDINGTKKYSAWSKTKSIKVK